MEQKAVCIMMWKGESYQQPCEGVMDRVDKQRDRDDVDEREHKVKQGHLNSLQAIAYKQGSAHQAPLRANAAAWQRAPLGYLCTPARSAGNRHEESGVCVQLHPLQSGDTMGNELLFFIIGAISDH